MSGEPCKPTGNTFKATGTIRVRIGSSDGSDAGKTKIFLTPIDTYSASHGGKQFALFFPGNGGEHCVRSGPYEPGEGVPICVQTDFAGLVAAAAQQTAVEIEVAEKCTTCPDKECKHLAWVLRAITIPAPGERK